MDKVSDSSRHAVTVTVTVTRTTFVPILSFYVCALLFLGDGVSLYSLRWLETYLAVLAFQALGLQACATVSHVS